MMHLDSFGELGSQDELTQENRTRCRCALSAHFCLDPDTLSLCSGARSELHPWPGPDTAVIFGGILEVIVALAGIGTAVALYPVLKRQNEGVALGLVGSRVLEAAGILAGVACLLAIVSLREAGAGYRSVGHRPDAGHSV
jgi:hypothetical protein